MTYIYTEQDYLAHFGVKGMKWGVRKEREYRGIRSRYNARRARNVQRAIDSFSDPRVTSSKLSEKDKRDAVSGLEELRDRYKSKADKYNKTPKRKESAEPKDRRKQIAKRVAIGAAVTVGVLAVVGGVAYSKAKYDKNIKLGAMAADNAEMLKKQLRINDRTLTAARKAEWQLADDYNRLKSYTDTHADYDAWRNLKKVGENLDNAKAYSEKVASVSDDLVAKSSDRWRQSKEFYAKANKTVYGRARRAASYLAKKRR